MRTDLIRAATLAESLSASRRKKIELQITSKGIRIRGAIHDEGGRREIHNSSIIVRWQDVFDRTDDPLRAAIEAIDAQLVKIWMRHAAFLEDAPEPNE